MKRWPIAADMDLSVHDGDEYFPVTIKLEWLEIPWDGWPKEVEFSLDREVTREVIEEMKKALERAEKKER